MNFFSVRRQEVNTSRQAPQKRKADHQPGNTPSAMNLPIQALRPRIPRLSGLLLPWSGKKYLPALNRIVRNARCVLRSLPMTVQDLTIQLTDSHDGPLRSNMNGTGEERAVQ